MPRHARAICPHTCSTRRETPALRMCHSHCFFLTQAGLSNKNKTKPVSTVEPFQRSLAPQQARNLLLEILDLQFDTYFFCSFVNLFFVKVVTSLLTGGQPPCQCRGPQARSLPAGRVFKWEQEHRQQISDAAVQHQVWSPQQGREDRAAEAGEGEQQHRVQRGSPSSTSSGLWKSRTRLPRKLRAGHWGRCALTSLGHQRHLCKCEQQARVKRGSCVRLKARLHNPHLIVYRELSVLAQLQALIHSHLFDPQRQPGPRVSDQVATRSASEAPKPEPGARRGRHKRG